MRWTNRASRALLAWMVGAVWPGAGLPARAQSLEAAETWLRVVVVDQTSAVVPGARVELRALSGGAGEAPAAFETDSRGQAVFHQRRPGIHLLRVEAGGFEAQEVFDLRLRPGENRHEVRLRLAQVREEVTVRRDRRDERVDSRGDAFATVLGTEQIGQLPDDPEEMEEALVRLAGPGAAIMVNGFRGGRLPPRSQIQYIRIRRDLFAAEHHDAGIPIVEISTKPGSDAITMSIESGFGDAALNARNALAERKGGERRQRVGLHVGGPIQANRSSFALSLTGTRARDTSTVFVALPGGRLTEVVPQPLSQVTLIGRVAQAVRGSHVLRGEFQHSRQEDRNQGVGGLDLTERAFERVRKERLVRLSEAGPIGARALNELRFQVRWDEANATSVSSNPALVVLGAFSGGGAQVAGGRRRRQMELTDDLDYVTGRHRWRFGARLETADYRSDDEPNAGGTFTFSNLDAYIAGRPATYTQRVGNPLVQFWHHQFGWYAQDEIRLRTGLSLSLGVRHEAESRVDGRLTLAPRAGVAWSPSRRGTTTVRGGAGLFYDWVDAHIYEQTLRVDGTRQRDIIVMSPGYPDPFAGGQAEVLPPSRYEVDPSLRMPAVRLVSAGVEQQLLPGVHLVATFSGTRGWRQLRGRNVNAPMAGSGRPNPTFGNITRVESSARSASRSLNVALNCVIPGRQTFVAVSYTWGRTWNEADGPFSLPADSRDPRADWGPSSGDVRQRVGGYFSARFWKNLRVGLNVFGTSAPPYTITTGFDDNADSVLNDRPAGAGRNSARGAGMLDVSGRASWAVGLGRRRVEGGPERWAGAARSGAGDSSARDASGPNGRRFRFELVLSVQNLLNRTNPAGFAGVLTSPLFGQAVAAMPARRVELGARVYFRCQ